jgi:hypothetical protein
MELPGLVPGNSNKPFFETFYRRKIMSKTNRTFLTLAVVAMACFALAPAVQGAVIAGYTFGTEAPGSPGVSHVYDDSVASPGSAGLTAWTSPYVSDSDFVNGATPGGGANGNGATLTLNHTGMSSGSAGLTDGKYLDGEVSNNTAKGWMLDDGLADGVATFDFTSGAIDIGSIQVFMAYSWGNSLTKGASLDALVEVDYGAGFMTLVDAGRTEWVNKFGGEIRLDISANAGELNGVEALRMTFDPEIQAGATDDRSRIMEIDVFESVGGGAAVPEPSTFALAALGLLGLIGFGRRRKR